GRVGFSFHILLKGAYVMKKALGFLLLVCFGAALGRIFDGRHVTLARGEGQGGEEAGGGGVEKCAAKNGDVNADGGVDLSDAITILGNLFLGTPPELPPLCVPPDLAAQVKELESQLAMTQASLVACQSELTICTAASAALSAKVQELESQLAVSQASQRVTETSLIACEG